MMSLSVAPRVLLAAVVIASAAAHPPSPTDEITEPRELHRKPSRQSVAVTVDPVTVAASVGNFREETQTQLREQIEILAPQAFPTVKCAEIVPQVGEPSPENHDACNAHCVALATDYQNGRCLRGVCHCSLRPQQSSSTPTVRHKIETDGHPTVRCEHIIPEEASKQLRSEDDRACKSHCNTLGSEYASGECLRGICHCRRHLSRSQSAALEKAPVPAALGETASAAVACKTQDHGACLSHCQQLSSSGGRGKCVEGVCRCESERIPVRVPFGGGVTAHPPSSHPTVMCEHLVPLHGEPSSESHGLCLAHCRSLGEEFERGDCVRGVCHCHRSPGTPRPSLESGLPTVRCEHIVPLAGQASPENHEACSSHCLHVGGRYEGGKCVSGVCTCKVRVSETAIADTVVVRQEVVPEH